MTDPIDIPITEEEHKQMAAQLEREWEEIGKPIWERMKLDLPPDWADQP